jgi:hypothetical protein
VALPRFQLQRLPFPAVIALSERRAERREVIDGRHVLGGRPRRGVEPWRLGKGQQETRPPRADGSSVGGRHFTRRIFRSSSGGGIPGTATGGRPTRPERTRAARTTSPAGVASAAWPTSRRAAPSAARSRGPTRTLSTSGVHPLPTELDRKEVRSDLPPDAKERTNQHGS